MTLKKTSVQVVETSANVNNNSFFQNYANPDDHTRQTTDQCSRVQTIYSIALITIVIVFVVWCDLPWHWGAFPLHAPSLHVVFISPLSSKPWWHVKLTDLP